MSGRDNTHQLIQQVSCTRGLTANLKLMLIHCLERYQIKDAQGHPYGFTSYGFHEGTDVPRRSVDVSIEELKAAKVLHRCGKIWFDHTRHRPSTVYRFNIEALKPYLEGKGVKAEAAPLIKDNGSNAQTHLEAAPKEVVKARVKARVKATIANQEEVQIKEVQEKKEEEGESTLVLGDSVSSQSHPPPSCRAGAPIIQVENGIAAPSLQVSSPQTVSGVSLQGSVPSASTIQVAENGKENGKGKLGVSKGGLTMPLSVTPVKVDGEELANEWDRYFHTP